MKRSFFFGAISLVILVACVLLRECLLDIGLPDGMWLENLAQELRGREVTAAEAVAAFCRELMAYGPT